MPLSSRLFTCCAFALTLGFATTLQGQDTAAATGPTCVPNAFPTPRLISATLSLQRAFLALSPNPQDADSMPPVNGKKRTKADTIPVNPVVELKNAIRTLTRPPDKKDKLSDSLGINYYLGQAYMVLLEQPGINAIGRRGDFGIATDTSLTIDLLAAADTLLTKVSETMPGCAAEVARWRQQKPWVTVLNGSIAAVNSEQFDSAEVLAKRSLIIERTAPYAYTILASVANNRKEYDKAMEYYNKVLEIAKSDTLYADEANGALYGLAQTTTLRAEAAPASDSAQRVAATQDAIKAWQDYMPVGTRDVQIAQAVQMVRKLLARVSTDSSKFSEAYAPILADPAHYGEATLLNSGLIAMQAKKPQDAAKLFAAVVEKNPYQRDALNNLAASYAATGEAEKMLPLIDRLVTIDPNNEDNWLLYAYAYSGLLKKDQSKAKIYTDSMLKYNNKAEQLTPRLRLTSFSHDDLETALFGSLEHYFPQEKMVSGKTVPTAKKSPPKTYVITFEFINEKGEVLGTESVSVGPVAQGATESFNVSLKGKNAAAFRYTIKDAP